MISVSAFAYAQARLQARYGARPSEAVWEGLHALAELPAWLEQARATALRHWLTSISVTTPPHEIECLLHTHLRDTTGEVAHWVPSGWHAAVRWTEILQDLPALAHLLRGEAAYPWMRAEQNLRAVAEAEPALRWRVLAQGPWAALATRRAEGVLLDFWLAEWQRRWRATRVERSALEQLVALLRSSRTAFLRLDGARTAAARRALEARLAVLFRRGFSGPLAVFAWLLLATLELERLRGELVSRVLFSPADVPATVPDVALPASSLALTEAR